MRSSKCPCGACVGHQLQVRMLRCTRTTQSAETMNLSGPAPWSPHPTARGAAMLGLSARGGDRLQISCLLVAMLRIPSRIQPYGYSHRTPRAQLRALDTKTRCDPQVIMTKFGPSPHANADVARKQGAQTPQGPCGRLAKLTVAVRPAVKNQLLRCHACMRRTYSHALRGGARHVSARDA